MNIIISNTDKRPIYDQICSQIRSQILAQDLRDGDKIPSIRFLAKELQISVITTKRAYDELEKEGLVVTVPGKGTFVSTGNGQLIREAILKDLEDLLSQALNKASLINLDLAQVKDILEVLYKEENL